MLFEEVLIDFCWGSFLLLLGLLLRSKIRFLQRFFIPVSVIAGITGLLLGPNVLGQFCPYYIHWSKHVSEYANPLLAILFITQFLDLHFNKKMIKKCLSVFSISTVVIASQILIAMTFVKLFHIYDGISLLPFSGFFGAHGLPGTVAGVFQKVGYWDYNEAFSVGNSFATFGMLWGIFIGIILINIGVRRLWLVGGKAGNLSEEEMTGILHERNRGTFMKSLTASVATDSLAIHVAIVGITLLLGYGLLDVMHKVELFSTFAITIPAMFVALLFGIILRKTPLASFVDGESLEHIGSTALEFLIAISVATTDLVVVVQYIVPILVISVIALSITTFFVLFLSKKWIKDNWFENAMVMLGSWSGSTATGMMLLHVVDPDLRSDAARNLIAATPFWQLSTQSFYLTIAPYIVITAAGFNHLMLGTFVLFVGFMLFGIVVNRKS